MPLPPPDPPGPSTTNELFIKVDGEWRMVNMVYINVGGTWHGASVNVKVSGTWKQ